MRSLQRQFTAPITREYRYQVLSKESQEKFKELHRQGLYPVPRSGIPAFKTARRGEVYCNITRYPGDSTSSEDLTKAEIACREQIVNCIAFLRRELPEFKTVI